ncbi:MAG TPA: lamin tail domain-containing protein [Candidatus Acidoferrum sp.]|nr:lamin tail domain-containing protein [Candidatus Acidoferrum sp.]
MLINEWMTAQSFGNDFIELLNIESVPVDLGGCFMSDVPANAPAMHQFPPLTFIGASTYLVLVADGDTDEGADHLSFKLSSDRGEIALFSPTFTVIDWILYGPQSIDISEGRTPDASPNRGFFTQPTPGAPNPSGGSVLITVSNAYAPLFTIDGKSWKFEASGTDLGSAWRASNFNDSAWSSGFALFGRETSPAIYNPFTFQTAVPAPSQGGPNTAYYRTRFTWNNGPGWTLWLTNLVDDGAVYYLNGGELTRLRVTANPVLYSSSGQNSSEPAFDLISVNPTNLFNGENVLAVEVHQSDSGSSDDVFGLGLGASKATTNIIQIAVVLNEVMANNQSFSNVDGTISDWLEIFNPTTNTQDLADMSLSDDLANSRRWVFPSGVTVAPGAYLIVKFDGGVPASTNNVGVLNTGFGFSSGGDKVLLFDKTSKGGGLLESITFGLQAPDFTISRVPNATGAWTLSLPTESSPNIATALGNAGLVRINEWMPDPKSGDEDWFELHNPNSQPVSIGGFYLTDNLAIRTQYRIPNLSFIGTELSGFVQFFADDPANDLGADHTNFKLSAALESIGLYAPDGVTKIDSISWTNAQSGVSEGRFPDGAAAVIRFPETPTPARSNFLPFNNLFINEVLTHSDPPLEDAIELFNPTATPINIGGWFLSDSPSQPKKYRFPDNTIVQANSFLVIYENQFNATPGLGGSFALSSSDGDSIHISVADAVGNLTGFRVTEDFGPQANGISFGKFETSIGYDFVAMTARSFGVDNPATVEQFRTGIGATNPYSRVGPVVINEIHYRPPDVGTNDNTFDEFIEMYNLATTNVALFDPAAPTNTWHVRNAVEFDFPSNVTMAARSYLLLVGFDPSTNATATDSFRSRYGVGAGVPIYGPITGKLANDEDNVELRRPDVPNANDVPYVLVEKVHYLDSAPWPGAADWNTNGTRGISLQRISPQTYANDPTNWLAGVPTGGLTNGGPFGARPFITLHPFSRVVALGSNVLFNANAVGGVPLTYQWRFNGIDILNATNTIYTVTNAQHANVGRYSLRMMNPFGVTVTSNALLAINASPEIVFQPENKATVAGASVTFTVGARGAQPLLYQWRKDGAPLSGATAPSFSIASALTNDAGNYTVIVSNSIGSITSSIAVLTFNASPLIVNQPQSTNVFVGQEVTFAVNAVGSLPLRYQWRFNGANIGGQTNITLNLTNLQLSANGNYSVLVSNTFGTVLSVNAALVVTIPPVVRIIATDANGAETGLDPGQFLVSRTVTSNTAITVNFTLGGTAANGADYQPITSSVILPVGVTSAVVNITPINDATPEAQETVVLTISASTTYAVGSPNSATVTILDNDNVLPSVALTAPANGAVYPVSPTNIFVSANASDPDGGVSKVEFFSNVTNKIGEVFSPGPYNFNWINATAGTNILTAVASDVFGATASSAPVSIYVNAAPTVVITSPADNSNVPEGDVLISATANDFQGQVTRVDFFFGGSFFQTVSNAPYSVLITNLALGPYQTHAIAYDNFGVSTASDVANFMVVVANTNFADMFVDRGFISGLTNFSLATNASSSVEPGEQQHSNVGGRSMWLTWTAPAAGVVTIDLLQSTFDTLMAIYTNQPNIGPTVSNIVKVAQNDDSNVIGTNATRSRAIFTNNVPGRQFHIAADGWRGANGVLQMHLSLSNTSPYITTQPLAQTNSIGTSAIFNVAATGATALSYFWRFNGVTIPGANGVSHTVNNIQPANNGVYDVIVSNTFGIATSLGANLVVRSTPIITQQPQNQNVTPGQNASFTVAAQGGSLVYQWRFNSVNIPAATSAVYLRPNIGPSDLGTYVCVITNTFGSITSTPAALTLSTPLFVRATAYSNGVFYGSLSGGVTNRGYFIEVSTNFNDGWANVRTVSNLTGSVSWADTNAAPRRNYRARLVP